MKELSALELWKYAKEVLAATDALLEELVDEQYGDTGGDMEREIRALDKVLSREFSVPESFRHPPDEIPF